MIPGNECLFTAQSFQKAARIPLVPTLKDAAMLI
jgi:hypothetical protein